MWRKQGFVFVLSWGILQCVYSSMWWRTGGRESIWEVPRPTGWGGQRVSFLPALFPGRNMPLVFPYSGTGTLKEPRSCLTSLQAPPTHATRSAFLAVCNFLAVGHKQPGLSLPILRGWSGHHRLSSSGLLPPLPPGPGQHIPTPPRERTLAGEAINTDISASRKFS